MGVTRSRLEFTVYKRHAGEAWLAPLTIQAKLNAKEQLMFSDAELAFASSEAPAEPALVKFPG